MPFGTPRIPIVEFSTPPYHPPVRSNVGLSAASQLLGGLSDDPQKNASRHRTRYLSAVLLGNSTPQVIDGNDGAIRYLLNQSFDLPGR